ncbi:hypothetical protein E2C01_096230 [Portunus trituberculatus]|uniref:Uncharacterized protein n=1 Tax=Portunus trituberculatus TaxID=210409 RepID=A0A5B7K1H8_PORTR|nr:hypothetical protein [Portunus trituberculatus]
MKVGQGLGKPDDGAGVKAGEKHRGASGFGADGSQE